MADITDFENYIQETGKEFLDIIEECKAILPRLKKLNEKNVIFFSRKLVAGERFPIGDAIEIINNGQEMLETQEGKFREFLKQKPNNEDAARAWESFDTHIWVHANDLAMLLKDPIINPQPDIQLKDDPFIHNFLTA